MVNKDNQPEFVRSPSKGERRMADLWKSSSQREARTFDKRFRVEEVTGFENQAKDLWMTYFAAYWAADEFHDPEINEGMIDAGSKLPIIGGLVRFVRSSENGGKIAWVELMEEAETKTEEYVHWLEHQTAKQTLEIASKMRGGRDKIPEEGSDDLQAFIDRLKEKGHWNKVYDPAMRIYGNPRSVQMCANLICTLYRKHMKEDSKDELLGKMRTAAKRFAPDLGGEQKQGKD